MNVTEEIRKEIAIGERDTRETKICFLAALVKAAGSLTLKNNKVGLEIESKSRSTALAAVMLFKELFGVEVEFSYSSAQKLYFASVKPGRAKEIAGILLPDDALTEPGLGRTFATQEEEAAFARGLFTANGSAYVPDDEGGGYHLEFSFFGEESAKRFAEILGEYDIAVSIAERGEYYGVYCKSGSAMSDILAFMGAYDGVLRLNELIVRRAALNNINRGVNCSIANMDKAQRAATQLIEAIARLKAEGTYELLDPKLKSVCEEREKHPDYTMAQLAEALGISKSGLNHRIEKILKEDGKDEGKR
ncbi:MAG TPA: DNA-binding protein WhiA [Candidatus Ornithoclostridium excrementipullorum]|nr:DNA-binding protein WhiA [Candidatus Ornithoclostridium excrementipullorum]